MNAREIERKIRELKLEMVRNRSRIPAHWEHYLPIYLRNQWIPGEVARLMELGR